MKAINREILSIAVPSIITNITTPLLALMDVVIVGHMGSADYIAAIAVGGTMFNMIYWLFSFLRMGSSGLTAQAYGASDPASISLILIRGLSVAIIASILIIIFSDFILDTSLMILEVEGKTKEMASVYFSILIWGAPATLSTFALTGWFLGIKNAKAPMWISFIINIANITVSLSLVIIFEMKIEGVAIGTLSAQWLGLIAGTLMARSKFNIGYILLTKLLNTSELKRFFTVNTDIFIRTLCLIAVTVWFTRIGSSQGTVILAVNTLLMQFFIFFSYFMDGFAFAGESLCGYYIGERNNRGLKTCIRHLFKWSAIMVIVFTITYTLFGEIIMNFISDEPSVTLSSKEYFNWVIAIPMVGFAAFTWDGIFIGATRTREMLLSMALSTLIYFAVYHFAFPTMGNHGLWAAFLCYLLSRGLILTMLRKRLTA